MFIMYKAITWPALYYVNVIKLAHLDDAKGLSVLGCLQIFAHYGQLKYYMRILHH